MSAPHLQRLTRELNDIAKNPDHSIHVEYNDEDLTTINALLIGPASTAYGLGMFDFRMSFGKDYPTNPPKVVITTTNGGRTRFNPNLYATGKVCLSILGTWRGEPGEQWSSAHGISSVLLSIHSLMGDNPYLNEPGFENSMSNAEHKKQADAYNRKIRHETIRISVCQRLEAYLGIDSKGLKFPVETDADSNPVQRPHHPHEDTCKQIFLMYYQLYLDAVKEANKDVNKGQQFLITRFESTGNQMAGTYDYESLERRLIRIRRFIDEETESWADDGRKLKEVWGPVATLKRQFEEVVAKLQKENNTITMELDEGSPLTWTMIYFGRPMTNLDGGMWKIRIQFSSRFPEEAPRIQFKTPFFHPNVTEDGVPWLDIRRADHVEDYIRVITNLLERDDPCSDPSTLLNPEASKMYWNNRKEYNRKVRRVVSRSMEYE
ncbi:hypothetical protein YB2330_003249 [Saitoella coloradoensis]